MKKVFYFILSVLVLCPVIFVSVLASNGVPVDNPQDIHSQYQLSNYVDSVVTVNNSISTNDSLSNRIPATITFADYISFEELEAYIETYDVELQQIQLRGFMEDGTRVTMATLVHKGMDETKNLVYTQSTEQQFDLAGITDVYAYVVPSNIVNMSNDALTYLVDTSYAIAPADNNVATTAITPSTSSEFPKSLTWELENLNLM